MSRMQRNKGARGEREFFGLLSDYLGSCVRRNVDQARKGGADGIEVPGWAIEVKRHESGFRSEWWEQACEQADLHFRIPALAYRASRQPWRVRVPLSVFTGNMDSLWCELNLDGFALVVRENLADGWLKFIQSAGNAQGQIA